MEAPSFEDTVAIEEVPTFESTSPVDEAPPAFEDTTEITEESQSLGDIGRQFVSSIAKSTIDPLVMASRIGSKLPGGKLSEMVSSVTGAPSSEEIITEMEGTSARTADDYGVNPKHHGTFASQVARGFGQAVPTLAAGRAAPIVSALMAGEQGFQEAQSFGATGAKLIAATGVNATTALITEKLMGVPKILGLIKNAKPVGSSILKTALKTAGFEGGQEVIEQVMQDWAAQKLYDPKRKIFDWGKLATVFGVGAFVGGGVGGVLQTASNLSTPKSTGATDPKTIAPKAQVQEVAQVVDESLAQIATEEPPPIPAAQPEVETPPVSEAAPVQPATTEPAPEGPRIVSTGIMTPEGIATFGDWNTKHADIISKSETIKKALDEGMEIEQLDANKGFIVEENGKQRFVGRKEALEIARKSGQVDESAIYDPNQGLISEALIEPRSKKLTRSDIIKSKTGDVWFQGITSKGIGEYGPTRWVTSNLKKAIDYATRHGAGGSINVFTPDQIGETAFAELSEGGATITPQEYAKRISEDTTIQGTETPTPNTVLTIEDARLIADPNAAANELQQYREQAIEAARAAGATDPEQAASIAQQQSAEKGNTDPALFIETARRRGLDQQRAAKPTVPSEEAPEASVERGPRAEAVSEEDIQSIEGKVSSLPEVQRNIIRELENDPDLTDQEVGSILNLTVDQVKKAKSAFRKTMREFIAAQGIGARLGPGAANVEEALAQYEVRKFGKRFQETDEIAPEIKAATGDRFYEPIPNQVTAEKATEIIEKNGEENAEEQIRDEKSSLSFADRATVGQILIKKMNERFQSIKDKTSSEAKAVLDRASDLAEWAADFGTRLGQGVQSFAMWVRLTAQGKLRAYEKVVKARHGDYTRNNRNDIDEIKDIVNTDGPATEKVKKIRKLKSPTARKVKSKAGRIIQAAKDGKLTDEKFYEATAEQLGLPVFNPEIAKTILDLATKVDQAPDGMPKQQAMLELNKFLAGQKGYNPSDLLWGYYYGNILSGTGTQLVNFVDTGLNILNESFTLALQNPRSFAKVLGGLARGAASSRADIWMAITQGRRISDGKFVEDPFFMEIAEFGKKGGVPLKSDTALRKTIKSLAESKIAYPLNTWKYVGRIMSASDALMFRAAQEAKAAVLANQMADGVTTADQILGYDQLPEFRAQAESEGYRGLQAKARATELMLMSRPAEIQKASTDFASEGTYNVKPYGLIGTVANSVESLSRKVPPLKLIVPFTRIVGNVLNRNLNNTPFGYYRAIRGRSGSQLDPKTLKQYTAEERNALLIRATVSTALLSAAGALHALGYIQINGGGPADPEKKKQLRSTGWKPYTVKIGDHYWNYSSTPIALGLSILGNFLDNAKYNDFTSKDMTDKVAYALQAVSGSLLNQSFLTNLGTFWDALSSKNPGEQFNSLKRLSANTASALGVPMSSLVKDVEGWITDPNIPKANTLKEALISQIPFASQVLKPQLNAFEKPIKSDRSRFETPITSDPAWKVVIEKGLRVPVPNNFFDDPDKQYEYVKEQGQFLEKWVLANQGRLRNMDSEHAQDAIENASDNIRMRVRNKFLRQGVKKKQ